MAGYGHLVAEARDAAGLTQAELADLLSVAPSIVSRIESERISISASVFNALIVSLPGLSAPRLLNAMGFPVTVPGADRLPRSLVLELLQRSPAELDALVVLLRGTPPPARQTAGRPR